jgi:hypothetical protein
MAHGNLPGSDGVISGYPPPSPEHHDLTMPRNSRGRPSEQTFLAGGGKLSEIIASFDWSKTPLGPIEGWPTSIKTSVGLILRSPIPIVTLWGEQGTMIYNDAYSQFAGGRHPGPRWPTSMTMS